MNTLFSASNCLNSIQIIKGKSIAADISRVSYYSGVSVRLFIAFLFARAF